MIRNILNISFSSNKIEDKVKNNKNIRIGLTVCYLIYFNIVFEIRHTESLVII